MEGFYLRAAIVRNRILSAVFLVVVYGACFVGAVDDITTDLAREWRRRV